VTGTLYYLNADFDLSLRARPRALLRSATQRTVRAMTVNGLLLGGEGDAVLTKVGVPGDFLKYLQGQKIVLPRLLRHPEIDRGLRLCPFGWSAEAMVMNEDQQSHVRHPPLELLRSVNSRGFSASLERDHFCGEDAGRQFSSSSDLDRWLGGQGDREKGWVVKADHGNAGVGNRRLRQRALSPEDRRFVDALLEEDDQVTVEPWRERIVDLCAVFTLSGEGEPGPVRLHETVYTRDGALIGALFEKGYGDAWRDPMERAAGIIAGELSRRGYFGPVCFDAFVYREGGEERLRPLVDLNCRRPVSDAIRRLWRDRLGDRVLYWRFFSSRKLRPETAEMAVGSGDHFDPGTRRGVLLTSPWTIEIDSQPQRPPKLAVAFVGEDRSEVQGLESAFRARCER